LAGEACPPFVLGKARQLLAPEGKADVAVLAYGTPALTAMEVARKLAGEYRVAVYDARFAKPVDTALLRELARAGTPILTLEDHTLIGGFGAAVLEAAQELGLPAQITRLGLPDTWIAQDSRARQ